MIPHPETTGKQDPMQQHAAPPAVAVEITASAAGGLVLTHNVGDDWAAVMLGVQPSADPATGQPHVTITAEADADGMAIAVITDRAGLDRLIAYLTGARDQWQAAA